MNFDELYKMLNEMSQDYIVIDEFVRTKEGKQVTDRTLINNVRFANLWANATLTRDKKSFNSKSKQTYNYFMNKVKEQLEQNGTWDIEGLKLGTSLLIPKSLYPREILNQLFYDEMSTRIVAEFIHQNFDVKKSIGTRWKQVRANIRVQGSAKNFQFGDLKKYYETYEIEGAVYKNSINGKEIIDDVKKIRIAFSKLWHKAAKTRVLSADKDYYVYCADAADTYDAIRDNMKNAIRYDETFDLSKLMDAMQPMIEMYPDAESILNRLFQTEMDAQITYDFFHTLEPSIKGIRNLVPTIDTFYEMHKQKVYI